MERARYATSRIGSCSTTRDSPPKERAPGETAFAERKYLDTPVSLKGFQTFGKLEAEWGSNRYCANRVR
jgi:hypothetical protein